MAWRRRGSPCRFLSGGTRAALGAGVEEILNQRRRSLRVLTQHLDPSPVAVMERLDPAQPRNLDGHRARLDSLFPQEITEHGGPRLIGRVPDRNQRLFSESWIAPFFGTAHAR